LSLAARYLTFICGLSISITKVLESFIRLTFICGLTISRIKITGKQLEDLKGLSQSFPREEIILLYRDLNGNVDSEVKQFTKSS